MAVIGDMVGSRQLADRALWQNRLEELMRELNAVCYRCIAAGAVLTLGDEFQVLLHSAACLPEILALLDSRMSAERIKIRLGLGIGPLSTALKPLAVGMDGPAFHLARRSIDRLKKEGGSLYVHTGDQTADTLWNALARLRDVIREDWTTRQRQIYQTFQALRLTAQADDLTLEENSCRVAKSGSQKELAAQMGITPSGVSKAFTRMHLDALMQAEAALVVGLEHRLSCP
ncbi:MAG TPA: hypothetical protein GXX29_09310 [Firmicutes bacterium]|nr:hypothetical protein [Bacillota bacterium]